MRINKYVAQASGLSRRQADEAVAEGRVLIDGAVARIGQNISDEASVQLDGVRLRPAINVYVMLHKPTGYVCSKKRQDEKPTVFELLPDKLQHLKVTGRLDADSRGLVILTNNGDYANRLMHPRYAKPKRYHVALNKSLTTKHQSQINHGIQLEDGVSQLTLKGDGANWLVTMSEGRNRQIRRTFSTLGYEVLDLFRIAVGSIELGELEPGAYKKFDPVDYPD